MVMAILPEGQLKCFSAHANVLVIYPEVYFLYFSNSWGWLEEKYLYILPAQKKALNAAISSFL